MNTEELEILETELEEMLNSAIVQLSDVLPSQWTEANRIMTSDETSFPGPFSYDRSPYCREIVDCFSKTHPAKKIAVMKGAQIGFSTSVIFPAICYIISQQPGNILFLTGHADLSEEAINNLDKAIDNTGIRKLIRAGTLRKRNSRTGDTNKAKEFPGGSLVSGSAGNHKLLRQRSVMYGFIDDFEAAKSSTSQSGSTQKMIEQRFAAYYHKMKLAFISTPEVKSSSNIEPVFLSGDQRYYNIPCQRCHTHIQLHWSIDIPNTDGKEKAGIFYKLDNHGRLIDNSVGYICQHCGRFFTESNKKQFLIDGFWRPTATPVSPDTYSYQISSLYAPAGMYNWVHYTRQYLEAYPPSGEVKETLAQTFQNLVLGLTYEPTSKQLSASQLQANCRSYFPAILPAHAAGGTDVLQDDVAKFTIPETLSINDGNGKIILLTLAADLNGTEDDARLDWEILAHAESGSTYSITHGSIGTFIPLEGQKKFKVDRQRFTYRHNTQNSVWPVLQQIIETMFVTDTNRKMKITIAGIDTGHYTIHAYNFMDKPQRGCVVVGLKGKDAEKYIPFMADRPTFHLAKERPGLYLVEVNNVKDDLADIINLRYSPGNDDRQPPGFANFPTPNNGLYQYTNYFAHFEAESRTPINKPDGTITFNWQKKNSAVQNHFWDVRVYNLTLREIFIYLLGKDLKIPRPTWSTYVELINKNIT